MVCLMGLLVVVDGRSYHCSGASVQRMAMFHTVSYGPTLVESLDVVELDLSIKSNPTGEL